MASNEAARSPGQPVRDIADVYDDPSIVWALRSVGTHLHPGGEDATVALATKAVSLGFPMGGRVLDIASALGGPARYLARRFAVTVLCIDANPGMHERALGTHRAEGMAWRCPLILARTERLPLAPASCDAAWSQDALCHMDKSAVVAEVARVLRPGALFAFTDWIARSSLSAAQSAELAALWSFPSLLRIAEWVRSLDESDFDVLIAEDRTAEVMRQRPPPPADQAVWEEDFTVRYGADELARQKAPGELWRSLMQANLTGYGLCIARRR